jgi:peptidoglycan/LPS O-acetylase OafA/YrhL
MLAFYLAVTRGAHAWAVIAGATYTTNIVHLTTDTIPWSLGHLWSLAQEEQFYLCWPPILLVLVRRWPKELPHIIGGLIVAVMLEKVALLSSGASFGRVYYGPDTHADPLLIGCLFGALFASGRAPRIGRADLPVLGLLLAAVASSEWLHLLGPTSLWRTPFAFGCGFLILAAAEGALVARLLAARPFVFLGQTSYSLYLWHVPILAAAGGAVYEHRPARALLAIAAAVVIASGSFFLIERPLRRRWRERRDNAVLTPTVQLTT